MRRVYLEKTRRVEKLTKSEQEELILDLVNAIVGARSVDDAALFLQDLLTQSEMKILGKRLRIAKLLLQGMIYKEIEKSLHASHATVAKIAAWLSERGDGFRRIIERLPEKKENKSWADRSDWDTLKRKYSLYFWPELLLGEIIKNANIRQKERMREVLKRLKEKSKLHKQIEMLLRRV